MTGTSGRNVAKGKVWQRRYVTKIRQNEKKKKVEVGKGKKNREERLTNVIDRIIHGHLIGNSRKYLYNIIRLEKRATQVGVVADE
jgi:hypothetical protein